MTPKQQRFVDEYLVDLNATQAATRTGYSAKTANEQGARLLANASIRAAIEQRQAARAAKHEITLDRLTAMTEEAYEVAKKGGEASGMVAAVRQLSKMHGFDVEKRENERSALADLPADVRRALLDHLGAARTATAGDRGGTAVH